MTAANQPTNADDWLQVGNHSWTTLTQLSASAEPADVKDVPTGQLQDYLDNLPSDREIDLTDLTPKDRKWLIGKGFDLDILDQLVDPPPPLTGFQAKRAFDLPDSARTVTWDRETQFLWNNIQRGNVVQPCLFDGKPIPAVGGYWLDPKIIVHFFHGQRPFFVFLTTFRLRPTVIYIPSLNVRLVTYTNDWISPKDKVLALKSLWARRARKVADGLSKPPAGLAYHIGFDDNIAHNARDEITGLSDVIDAGLLENIDHFFIGSHAVFGSFQKLFPEVDTRRLTHIDQHQGNWSIQDQYLDGGYIPVRATGTYISASAAERVVSACIKQCRKATVEPIRKARRDCFPLISITLRTRARAWADQEDGIAALAGALVKEFPKLGIVFDGVNDIAPSDLVSEEQRVLKRLQRKLKAKFGIPCFDTIGVPLFESIVWATAIDAYVAPHGAGLVKVHWLGGKPGVVHSNDQVIGRSVGICCDGTDVDFADAPLYVGKNAIKTLKGSGDQYKQWEGDTRTDLDQYTCDWRSLHKLLSVLLRRLDPKDRKRASKLVAVRHRERQRTHRLKAGHSPWISLRSNSRCTYGVYTGWPAFERGVHDTAPIVISIPSIVQSSPSSKLLRVMEDVGGIVLTPFFPSDLTGDNDPYAFCVLDHKGVRFDHLVLDMLDEFSDRYGIAIDKVYLSGGSGGAQFVNRFLLLHPDKVAGASMIAPGTITRPTPDAAWWVGLGDCEQRFGIKPDLTALRDMPIQIVCGEEDKDPAEGLSGQLWLDEAAETGASRLERAELLVEDLKALGAAVRFDRVPGIKHDLPELWDYAAQFFAATLRPDTN